MAYTLEILNTTATQIVQSVGLTPFTFFLASIGIATALLLLDLNKGASLDIPGRGQIGLSAVVFMIGAIVMILAAEGYQFFLIEVAKTSISIVIITPLALAYIGRKAGYF